MGERFRALDTSRGDEPVRGPFQLYPRRQTMASKPQQSHFEYDEKTVVTIRYTNYRGETGDRRIVPQRIRFGSTEWHREEQWLLDAFDIDRKADRSFAVKDILKWSV